MQKKIYANRSTQAELEQELKHDVIVDREIDDTMDYLWMAVFMKKIERMRKEREYSQKELAKKAGIGLSTYKGYLSGLSDNITLKTVLKIAHAFRCKLSDLVDEEH